MGTSVQIVEVLIAFFIYLSVLWLKIVGNVSLFLLFFTLLLATFLEV